MKKRIVKNKILAIIIIFVVLINIIGLKIQAIAVSVPGGANFTLLENRKCYF